MYPSRPGLLTGFHGCEKSVRDSIVSGASMLKASENDYDWLGAGFYFWENNYERALEFAQNPPGKKNLKCLLSWVPSLTWSNLCKILSKIFNIVEITTPMNFFRNLFNRTKAATLQCPRCLGKGHVDMQDIKRLGKELRWAPGKCAYCNGTGRVEPDMVSKVAVDEGYLTTNLSNSERKKIIDGDPEAIERMRAFDFNVDRVTREIIELYYVENLDAEEIAELYVRASEEAGDKKNSGEKKEMLKFINHVIANKK